MYNGYFVNTLTGQLLRTSQPSDNPTGNEWKQITWDEYNLFVLCADYYRLANKES